jgi:hypothetical protein
MATVINRIQNILQRDTDPAPLAVFRIAFGLLMFVSTLRFMLKGWVDTMYIQPKVFFPFFGWDWIQPLPGHNMYLVFALLMLTSLFIATGTLYRFSSIVFFLLFSYVELIDKTNYLNHYYFISLVAFLLIFLPAGKIYAVDNWFFKRKSIHTISFGYIFVLQLQMFTLYFFAGIAKLNYDWLIEAQPLRIWLPPYNYLPLIGHYMEKTWVPYLFAWFGCIYDLAIGFLLFNKRTVRVAYLLVIVFHLATGLFFNIGMFPWIMMVITTIFFPAPFHRRLLNRLPKMDFIANGIVAKPLWTSTISFGVATFFLIQYLIPFRYALYPGKLFWTEQGYRFSWRVMLMEKAGTALFTVEDKGSSKKSIICNTEHLTYMQEKMMSTQPDMLVDYAHYLAKVFQNKGYSNPIVKADVFVTVNGSGSKRFVDPTINLAAVDRRSLCAKTWVYSY